MTAVRERPLLLQAWGVRATLEDRKCLTRRVILPQPTAMDDGRRRASVISDGERRFGGPGDLLWVREICKRFTGCAPKGKPWEGLPWKLSPDGDPYKALIHVAGNQEYIGQLERAAACVTVPSIHMPRWVCRLTLRRTGDLRAERVQDIDAADVLAEGIRIPVNQGAPLLELTGKHSPADYIGPGHSAQEFIIAHFAAAWDDIHAAPKPAHHNPWTGEREDCYVSFPWASSETTGLFPAGRKQTVPWYVVGNPWVYVVGYERVKNTA